MGTLLLFLIFFAQTALADNLFDLSSTNYKNPFLVSISHGVGSKLKFAQIMRKHDTIGIDLVSTCLNALVAHGAEPIAFLTHLATGKYNRDQNSAIMQGIIDTCIQAKCPLTESNPLEVPQLYESNAYDLAGFAIGIVERDNKLPKTELITEGDVLIGLPSTGMHTSGYSFVHKLIEDNNFEINAKPPFATYHATFAAALLEPTNVYTSCVLPLCKTDKVKAIASLSQEGLLESMSNIMPDHLSAYLDIRLWYIPPIFRWFKHIAHITDHEMLNTFNCGIGMVLVADRENAPFIIQHCASHDMKAHVIGVIENKFHDKKVSLSGSIPTHVMKILVVGAGSSEHALAWKLAQSPYVGLVLVAPGNGGTARDKKIHNIPINPQHTNALLTYAKQQEIDLIIVGSKEPLINGFVDECTIKGLRCLGPSKTATLIDESIFATEFMMRHKIPMYNQSHHYDAQEISFMVLTDGKNILPLATCQNHKNPDGIAHINDMGTYSPAPLVTPDLHDQIMHLIIEPTVRGMYAEGTPFIGFLHVDLMIKDGSPYVSKYHCHLGDPETHAIMMRLKSDFFVMCSAAFDGQLHKLSPEWDERPALSVVVGSNALNYKKGEIIVGITETDSLHEKIFHAQTAYDNGKLITNGERILCATALGETLLAARNNAYNLIKNIYWPTMHYQTDIGYKELCK